MRIFEFDDSADPGREYAVRIKLALQTLIGRSASKGQAANYNWAFLNQLPELKGLKLDQATFAKVYDKYPIVSSLVKNFEPSGISLKVPGVSQEKEDPSIKQPLPQHLSNWQKRLFDFYQISVIIAK